MIIDLCLMHFQHPELIKEGKTETQQINSINEENSFYTQRTI